MSGRSVRIRRALVASSGAAALCALLHAPADAAAAPPASAGAVEQVQEVIVTAKGGSSDIQRTPLAVSVVNAKTLDQSFINSIAGLNAIVPSLEITKASGFENLVTIRGVGSQTPETAMSTVPGVSEFIDGVYIANTISLDQTLFDIDSIEVLRGPQGALYGQSSIGGAINIVTTQPKLGQFSGGADVSAGSYNLFRGRAKVNLPIGEDLAVRLSVQKYQHDGFTKNLAIPGNRLDDADDVGGKVAVLWQPSDRFSATLTGQAYHASQSGDAQKNILDPSPDPREVYQDYPGHFGLDTQLYHLNLKWELPWFQVTSVTAYQHLKNTMREDGTRSTFSLLGRYDDVAAWNTGVKNFTQEFDILSLPGSRLDWIAGAFVQSQRSTQFVAEFQGTTAPSAADLQIPSDIRTNPPANLAYGNDTHSAHRSYSVFAQATYHVTPDFKVTAGGRANIDYNHVDSQNFAGAAFGGLSHTASSKWDHVQTWRLDVQYDATADNMIYGSVARGYKPGGVNGSNLIYLNGKFEPETNTAFQVGSKNFLFDRTLRLNVEGFYYIHKNSQFNANSPVPFADGIGNIPEIRDYGVEVEGAYTGIEGRLHLNANLALDKGKVKGTYKVINSTVQDTVIANNANCAYGGAYYNPACWAAEINAAVDLDGKAPPAMPKVSGSVSAAYDVATRWGVITPRVQVIYRGSQWARIFNEPLLDRVPNYTQTNLGVEFAPTNSPIRLSLTATNVFNVDGVNSRYTDPFGSGQTSEQFIAPRQVIGTIAYAF